MAIDPRLIATEGVGGDPIAVATQGFIGDEDGTVTLTQTSGVASAEAFGSSSVRSTVFASGLNSTEEHGSNSVTCGVSGSGHASDEAFGSDGVNVTLVSAGVSSDETFGAADARVTVNSAGLGSDEAFGVSRALYDRTVTQHSGIPSAEAFGVSSVSRPSLVVDQRPASVTRRGGSSSTSRGNGPRWDVTVSAEMLTRAGEALFESEDHFVKGVVKKRIDAGDRVVVKARMFVGPVRGETPPAPVVIVQARLLEVNTLKDPPSIVVRAEKIAKVA